MSLGLHGLSLLLSGSVRCFLFRRTKLPNHRVSDALCACSCLLCSRSAARRMEPPSAQPSRKRSRSKDEGCRYVHKITGERCSKGSFHAGLHSFDTSVNSDINAWKHTWPRSLCLGFGDAAGVQGSEHQIDDSLLGEYRQAPEILNRRPVYEHENALAILVFGRDNTWAVRWSAGPEAVELQLKDACRTPDLSKKKWQRFGADGRLVNVDGLRCVVPAEPAEEDGPAEEAGPAAAGAATSSAASNADAGLEVDALAAFIEENEEDEWWHEPLEAIVVGE